VLPNVAIAELIDYQRGEPASDAPPWYLRQVTWRDRQLPLISFEAACGEASVTGERSRIVVLNTWAGGRAEVHRDGDPGIPRSYKLDSQLSYVDVPLCSLELAAVQVGEQVAKVPDLMGLEALLVESGLA
jgi:chemosensory pili system protein ChpC